MGIDGGGNGATFSNSRWPPIKRGTWIVHIPALADQEYRVSGANVNTDREDVPCARQDSQIALR